MAKIPIKFKRVAAAFDEAARWRRPCESSSGSEYWAESGTDLSDLVNSFIQNGDSDNDHHFDIELNETIDGGISKGVDDSDKDDDDDTERKDLLQGLLLECGSNGGDHNYGVKEKIYDEIEIALGLIGDYSSSFSSKDGFKRSVMAHLRDKGFDAGLCKSRWGKTGGFPAGTYEYIDVNMGRTRYIIEVFLAQQFEIARPTAQYSALLGMIPSILIIEKPKVLKQIMRLMSATMKKSMKHVDMHVPPWRRNGYLQAKYFSPYKRTVNREPVTGSTKREKDGSEKKKTTKIGFEGDLPIRVSYYCSGHDFACKDGVRVGLLAAVLQGR